MVEKVQALFTSRRFWVAIGGVAVVVFDGFGLGLTAEQTQNLIIVLGSWVVGHSIRDTLIKLFLASSLKSGGKIFREIRRSKLAVK